MPSLESCETVPGSVPPPSPALQTPVPALPVRLELEHSGQGGGVSRLGQEDPKNASLGHHVQHRHGVGRRQQAQQLVAHPLAGQVPRLGRQLAGRGQALRVRRPMAVVGVKAEEAQQAQIILTTPLTYTVFRT